MVFKKFNHCQSTTKTLMILSLGLLCSSSYTTAIADDVTIGDISARLDDLEKRVKGENPAGDELATKEDVDRLTNLVKALTGQVEMLEMKASGKMPAASDLPTKEESIPAQDAPVDADPDPDASDVSVDDGEVEDLLASLGSSKGSKGKAAAKEKVEEKREKATEKAEKAAPSLESGSPAAQFDQAKSLFNKKQYAEAENAFTYYLETYPKGKEAEAARVRLGEAQLEQAKGGDHAKADKAAATFAKAYKANPKGTDGAEALLGLAQAMSFKDKKKACTVLEKLQSDFPNNKTTSKKAIALKKKYKCS